MESTLHISMTTHQQLSLYLEGNKLLCIAFLECTKLLCIALGSTIFFRKLEEKIEYDKNIKNAAAVTATTTTTTTASKTASTPNNVTTAWKII